MVRNSGDVDSVQYFGLEAILPGAVGRQKLVEGPRLFPKIPVEVFNVIKDKPVEVLVGNLDLSLQPQCPRGFGKCTDCAKNVCCYQSHYGNGWVIIGRLCGIGIDKLGLSASIKRIVLCKDLISSTQPMEAVSAVVV